MSRSVSFYVPALVDKLLVRIEAENPSSVALYGFGEGMKWLNRILKDRGRKVSLFDWREKIVGYDCGGDEVRSVEEVRDMPKATLMVLCVEDVDLMKSAVSYLIDCKLTHIPTIYEVSGHYSPFHQESPYKQIGERAKKRRTSMIEDEKLFNLIQAVRATADVPGDVAEFGCFNGGSAAIIVEAVNHYKKKPVYLFDTFKGIPVSKYGLDHRWKSTFSNNSFSEVRDSFADCDNVKVISGPIAETHRQLSGAISFCHIAIDTMESAELLLNFIWPKLSVNGIVAVDDYGAFPNCLPLTVVTDRFMKEQKNAFLFHTAATTGFFAMKR